MKFIKKTVTLKVPIIIILLIFLMGLLLSFSWVTKRATIGKFRESLNHPEHDKDTLVRDIKNHCQQVKSNLFIPEKNKNYFPDDTAKSDLIYRYLVLDAVLLTNTDCTAQILKSINKQNYPIKIVFSSSGEKVFEINSINKKE